MNEVVLSELAESDLVEIWAFVARNNPEAADRLIDELYEKCRMLAGRPAAGRRRPELHPSIRSFGVRGYLIFYRQADRGIEVARVLHGRRHIPTPFER